VTQKQAIREFCRDAKLPPRDRPALREAWSFYIDNLARDGVITDQQAFRWVGPQRCPRLRRRR